MQYALFLFTLWIGIGSYAAVLDPKPVVNSLPCLISWVETAMNEAPRPDEKKPQVLLSHTVSLKQFQDDIESQWHQRPQEITNAFVAHSLNIYLNSDKSYYRKNRRSIYDSLVHELVHYIQVQYRHFPIDQFSEFEEMTATDLQTQFRSQHPELLNQDYKCDLQKVK